MHRMIELSVCNPGKIAVIGTFRLLIFGAILVFYPNIDVNTPLHIFFVLELDLEAGVTKPFDVYFAFQRFKRKRLLIQLRLHFLSSFDCCDLLRCHTRCNLWSISCCSVCTSCCFAICLVQLSSKVIQLVRHVHLFLNIYFDLKC